MPRMIEVRLAGRSHEVPAGTTAAELCAAEGIAMAADDAAVVAVMMNNEVVSLSARLEFSCDLVPIRATDSQAVRIYRRSLCFLLAVASYHIYPDRRLVIGHALGRGYYFLYEGLDGLQPDEVEALRLEMRRLVSQDLAIEGLDMAYGEALELFEKTGFSDTALLLRHRNHSGVPVHRCDDFVDLSHGPLVPSTGHLKVFDIVAHGPGMVLRYPPESDSDRLAPFEPSPLLFGIYQEYKRWGRVLELHSVGRLNDAVRRHRVQDFIRVAEALHSKKISRIAEQIAADGARVRVVLIAGPSSSGKTTFTKRLAIELRVLGFKPETISLDDYFLPRELTPRDDEGNYDFENLRALDIEQLNDDLLGLLAGEERSIPSFDFKTGRRKGPGRGLRLPENGILLIEGIHALNDDLTPRVARANKHRVYVSALTQLNLDDHNRISTTDNRLIRRMVRDYQFRGHTAHGTLEMWPSVRRGENRNIFPFQDTADSAFNSALDYELGVLKTYVEPLLGEVKPTDDRYHEARRLISFLDNFVGIPAKFVPSASILREFIGDSEFKY